MKKTIRKISKRDKAYVAEIRCQWLDARIVSLENLLKLKEQHIEYLMGILDKRFDQVFSGKLPVNLKIHKKFI